MRLAWQPAVAMALMLTPLLAATAAAAAAGAAPRTLLWGDTHLHTALSFDAFLNGNMSADPHTAYRYARGEPVIHPYNRTRVQIRTPLDFLVVSDHAEFLGGISDIYDDGIQDPDPNVIERLIYRYNEWRIRSAIDSGNGMGYFRDMLPVSGDPRQAALTWREGNSAPPGADVSLRNAWRTIIEAADAHNDPGRFSALIGWEWSSTPGGANLHRIVMSDADAAAASGFLPFSSTTSPYPEDLWRWLQRTSAETGVAFVAIPHNANISKGMMFDDRSLRGEPVGADYARLRRRFEPVMEVTQIKGDSETHPALSPADPFAGFASYPFYLQQSPEPYQPRRGDFARSALLRGLELDARTGENPYRFAMIGSTDSHTGLASAEEPNFWGKMARDSVPENKQGDALAGGPSGWSMSAAGLAGVWAEENTRGGIVQAFQRREVYATTGPRIVLRTFTGWNLDEQLLESPDPAAAGYRAGVPMGGVLSGAERGLDGVPSVMIVTARDPASAHLDRVQVIKGWLDSDGAPRERVYDAVWAGDRQPGPDGRVGPVGDTVNRRTGTVDDAIGAAELRTVWRDPDFDPDLRAFYYVRVLEIPTPRHALLDAIALGLEAPTEGPAVIQERAYSSPVWYSP